MVGKVLNTKKATNDQKSLIKNTIAFNKRKNCLKKKTFELSTLCEIDACILFVGPDGEIDIWPPEKHKLDLIMERYRAAGISTEEELKKKKKKNRGGEKQSKVLNEEESENKTLIPCTSDVLLLPENNTIEVLDVEYLEHLYFDPTVLDESPSLSSSWNWDWDHQQHIISGSFTEFMNDDDDPSISMMKFDDGSHGTMIEELSTDFWNKSYGYDSYETMDDDDHLILMCQMGTEEQSPSLLPFL